MGLRLTRRHAVALLTLGVPSTCALDAFVVEPTWLRVRRLKLVATPRFRIAHFTDIHYTGDQAYLERVVHTVNALKPDCACFTGDVTEDGAKIGEALALLSGIECPLFGVPGNWDHAFAPSFDAFVRAFEGTSGAWLVGGFAALANTSLVIVGADQVRPKLPSLDPDATVVMLSHYPLLVEQLQRQKYALILAGHSHGGQCRIPFLGAPFVPDRVGRYVRGLFDTPAGPLYVSSGVGTFMVPVRFACRPEVVLVEI